MLDAGEIDARSITNFVVELSACAPLVILLDEFGKSLEAAAGAGSGTDLFLLQELAEASRATNFAVVTLQHMGYGDYASDLSAAQRRDWAKVQGRFEEISYVEGSAQTLRLVANAFTEVEDRQLAAAISRWSEHEAGAAADAGLQELTSDVISGAWPLHPAALTVLPELVKRYGQNERTLFSFLAAPQPHSAASWLADTAWQVGTPLPSVRLPQLYDYFVEAATAMSGYSAAASRWLEIDTRIRDTRGLNDAQLRTLKAVGLLNLIAAGGELRAGRALLRWALADGTNGTATDEEVGARLEELESLGLLSWRDFSDEYRIWQGSDFDLRGAIERGRRQFANVGADMLLNSYVTLAPVVAARHSHRTGTLRHFERRWVGGTLEASDLAVGANADGLVLFATGPIAEIPSREAGAEGKPVLIVVLPDVDGLLEVTRELAALQDIASGLPSDDWVIIREVSERQAEARSKLDLEVDGRLQRVERKREAFFRIDTGRLESCRGGQALSALLSEIADDVYSSAPEVRNELLNRHDLSSQAAKARRELLAAMVARPSTPTLGIEGFGPERSMYEAVLRSTGMHRIVKGEWRLMAPHEHDTYAAVWRSLVDTLEGASSARLSVADIFKRLALPPLGIRAGLAPVLLTAVLLDMADVVAMYEHGTFKPTLTDDLLERLVKNPSHFELKHFGTRAGRRATVVSRYATALSDLVGGRLVRPSVVTIVGIMVQVVNSLPEFAKRSSELSVEARAVREAILAATEPDVLLFAQLPDSLGYPAIEPGAQGLQTQVLEELAGTVASALAELTGLYDGLLETVAGELADVIGSPHERVHANLCERAALLQGKVLDPRAAGFVNALAADLDRKAWLEYVAMVVGHTPPASWRDDDVQRFRAGIREVGATFRRVEALHSDANALDASGGFDAVRVTVTAPGGQEQARLVWVETRHRDELQRILDEALRAAATAVGEGRAQESLLALLAEPSRTVGAWSQDGTSRNSVDTKDVV